MRRLASLLLVLLPLGASAQSDDFGLDFWVEAQKKLSKQWNVSIEGEYRTRDNTKTSDRWAVGLNADYKAAKWLKASAGYTLLYDNNERTSYSNQEDVDDGDFEEVGMPKKCACYWAVRHRFNVSLTFDKKLFGDFRFSLRERWQYTYRPEHTVSERWSYLDNAYDGKEKTYNGKGKNVLRSRLQVEYDKKGFNLTPYVNVEFFNSWNKDKILGIDVPYVEFKNLLKVRYTAGLDWKFSRQHSLGFFYRYQNVRNDDDDNEPNTHLIGVGYKFKF